MTNEQALSPPKHYPAFSTEVRRSADGKETYPVGISTREYLFSSILQELCANESIYRACRDQDDFVSYVVSLADRVLEKATGV